MKFSGVQMCIATKSSIISTEDLLPNLQLIFGDGFSGLEPCVMLDACSCSATGSMWV